MDFAEGCVRIAWRVEAGAAARMDGLGDVGEVQDSTVVLTGLSAPAVMGSSAPAYGPGKDSAPESIRDATGSAGQS